MATGSFLTQNYSRSQMSPGGPADSRMAVCCRPLFPSHSNYSTSHAHERTEYYGSLPVVRRSTWREPIQLERALHPFKGKGLSVVISGISHQIWKWNTEFVAKFGNGVRNSSPNLEMVYAISHQICKRYNELVVKSRNL
ncbi:hypothetical protein TNCV_4856511 [Trichonephila clavipes]|nr:hypothetical protein TNCV_4856511 [Trichonephila clavipes]